jgi:hypothetical protein
MVTHPLLQLTLERMAHALGRKRQLRTNEKTWSDPLRCHLFLKSLGITVNQQRLHLCQVARYQKSTRSQGVTIGRVEMATISPTTRLAFLSRVSILLLLAGGAHRMEHSARLPALLIGRLYFPSIPAREARRCSLISHTSPTQEMESPPSPTKNPGE